MVKKLLPFSFLLLGAILIFTTSSSIDKGADAASEVAFSLTDRPVLPDEPFDYDLRFPDHSISNFFFAVDTADLNRELTPDGATLGRVLFYDKYLSFTNQLSCSSCHKQEFSFGDNQQFSSGNDGVLMSRNTLHLNDLIWARAPGFGEPTNKGLLYWDGRESFMEEMVLREIEHEDFLGKDLEYMEQKLALTDYYPVLFELAYGDPEITTERVGDALAQFILSLTSFDSKYDKVQMGQDSFNVLEEEGYDLVKNNCSSRCHAEPNYCSVTPMNNGLDAVYTDLGVANYSGRDADIGKFKSPSLRNVEMTAPYMHDGRFNTLEEVLDFYSEDVNDHRNADFAMVGEPDGFTGFKFTALEKEAIIAFLKTMTTPGLYTKEKWSDPFTDHVSVEEEQLSAEINVFPNPIAESFTIDLGDLTTKPTDLKMFDHAGKLVWENQTDGSAKQSFEVADLPTGVYVLQLAIDGVFASKKLLIR